MDYFTEVERRWCDESRRSIRDMNALVDGHREGWNRSIYIADANALGDGNIQRQYWQTNILAQNAKRVIAVDTSANMIEVARDQALRAGILNVEYRLGDMEDLPIDSSTTDLAFFSQSLHHALHPARALAEAHRILRPGGRIVILDLVRHRFEEARELYADEWLGFSESDLQSMLQHSGFHNIQTSIPHKEQDPPHFQTLLAVANKL